MIKLENVSKTFGPTRALNPINLSIDKGSTTVLIGPSGCGKSTLIRTIMGLVKPDTGKVDIDGNTFTTDNVHELRKRMGYVIQDGGLFPSHRARQCLINGKAPRLEKRKNSSTCK
jgi:ABC-type proline/glycine betaine transport systems, ATPase components